MIRCVTTSPSSPAPWPRYTILRVYRGLVHDPDGEPGWQHYKPSAIPAGDEARVATACAASTELRALQQVANEVAEGGDMGSASAVARHTTTMAPAAPAAWIFLAVLLTRGSRRVASVPSRGRRPRALLRASLPPSCGAWTARHRAPPGCGLLQRGYCTRWERSQRRGQGVTADGGRWGGRYGGGGTKRSFILPIRGASCSQTTTLFGDDYSSLSGLPRCSPHWSVAK
jgi:hypothetical protein